MNIVRQVSVFAATAAMGALVTFAASGCGGARAVAVTTNGLEKKTGAQVAEAAAAAVLTAKSAHVKGVIFTHRPHYRFDVRIQGASSAGTITLDGGQAQLIIIAAGNGIGYPVTYLKAGPEVLKKLFGASAPVQRIAGQWLKVPPEFGNTLPSYGFALSEFGGALGSSIASPPAQTVRQATLGSGKVVIVSYQDGSKLYVANTGPAYPLRWDDKSPGSWTDFSEYGTNFHITAPSKAIHITF